MQTSHTRLWLTGTLILLCVSILGVVVWWLAFEGLSAQTIMDPCADAEAVESSDFTVNWYNPEGELAARHVGHSSTAGMRIKNYDPKAASASTGARSAESESEPGLMSETIRLYGPGGSDQATRSGTSASSTSTEYSRTYQGGGQWAEWEVSERIADTGGATPATRFFCGRNLDRFSEFTYDGEVMLDGVSTKKYTGLYPFADGSYRTWEFWVDGNGRNVKNTSTTDNGYVLETYSYGWNEPNPMIAAPGQLPDAPAEPDTPTSTPGPTNTPEPTATPVPASAWLEPDPAGVTLGGEWTEFTVHGVGIGRIDLGVNVISPSGPSSTGALGYSSRSTPPPAGDACEDAYFSGCTKSVGDTVSFVGCREGVAVIQLGEYVGGSYVLLKRYTVEVSGGP